MRHFEIRGNDKELITASIPRLRPLAEQNARRSLDHRLSRLMELRCASFVDLQKRKIPFVLVDHFFPAGNSLPSDWRRRSRLPLSTVQAAHRRPLEIFAEFPARLHVQFPLSMIFRVN